MRKFARNAIRLPEPLLDSAGEVTFRKIEERVNTTRIDECAIEFPCLRDMGKKLRDRRHSIRLLAAPAESSGPHFERLFHLAEEQVILVAVVNIKSRPAHRGTVEDLLYG